MKTAAFFLFRMELRTSDVFIRVEVEKAMKATGLLRCRSPPSLFDLSALNNKNRTEEKLMGFNYASEKLRFDAEWEKLDGEYRAAGFDEAGIQAMRDYDWEQFRKRRTYENHNQELPSEVFDDGDDNSSTLLQKFCSLSIGFDESAFTGRHDWIEAIDNPVLAGKLAALSDTDKELLTLLAFDGYTQAEIAVIQGCSQQAVSKKINRIKIILK